MSKTRATKETPTGILASALATTLLAAPAAQAVDFIFLSDPALAGHFSRDKYWGNGDEDFSAGLNPLGDVSAFADEIGGFGFFHGTTSSAADGASGPNAPIAFGLNHHTSIEIAGLFDNPFALLSAVPFTQTMLGSSTVYINADQSFYTSYTVRQTYVVNGEQQQFDIAFQGSGNYLLSTQSAAANYSGDLLGHFNFVTTYLPDDWTSVAIERTTYQIISGPLTGVRGGASSTYYTSDALALLELPSLGAPWQTTGYAKVFEDTTQIGSPYTLTGGLEGTALLSGGAAAIADNVQIGAGFPRGTMTLAGADTVLSIVTDNAMLFVGDSGTLEVHSGALLQTLGAVNATGRSTITVTGEGSTLNAHPPTRDVSFYSSGEVDITDGGQLSAVTAITRSDASDIGIMEIDGVGSLLTSPASANYASSLMIESGAQLSVTHGGQVLLERRTEYELFDKPDMAIGRDPFSEINDRVSRVTVDGAGSMVAAAHALVVGFDHVEGDSGPNAELVVRNGGVVQSDTIFIGETGTLTGGGGTLIGQIENHGTLAPGESPGVLEIVGDLNQAADGRLVIEIAGAGPSLHDILKVSGTFNLSGTLEIVLLDGYEPDANVHFTFITAGAFTGAFDDIILPLLDGRPLFVLEFGAHGLTAQANPVPVPSMSFLFAGAILTIASRRLTRIGSDRSTTHR